MFSKSFIAVIAAPARVSQFYFTRSALWLNRYIQVRKPIIEYLYEKGGCV